MLPDIKHTALETSDNVKEVLAWKLEQLQTENLPVEEGLADYIALGIAGMDARLAQLKEYKRMIDEEIKAVQDRKAKTTEEIADWLENEMGIEKLKGVYVSSVTVKPKNVSITKKLVWDVDREAAVEKGLAHYEETIREIPMGVKINKRRKKNERTD